MSEKKEIQLLQARHLTSGEKLHAWRTRMNMTCRECAINHGVPDKVWSQWESEDYRSKLRPPRKILEPLEPGESMRYMRRRIGMTVAQLAEELGVSKTMIYHMESGLRPYSLLMDFWIGGV